MTNNGNAQSQTQLGTGDQDKTNAPPSVAQPPAGAPVTPPAAPGVTPTPATAPLPAPKP